MREILTVLASIIIVILAALIIGPHFVDWNGQREFIEGQLSRAVGQRVTVGGNIEVRLLPTPYLRLQQAVFGDDDASLRIGMRRLDLELAVGSLLHGEFDVTEGRLVEPRIQMTLLPDRALPSPGSIPLLKARIRLERLLVDNGSLSVSDPVSGRNLVLRHLTFTAEATNVFGPFRIAGSAGTDDDRRVFKLSTTELVNDRLHMRLEIEARRNRPAVELNGDLRLQSARRGIDPLFDGTLAVAGEMASGADGYKLSWRATGPLKADLRTASLGGTLSLQGASDLSLPLNLSAQASFGEGAKLAVKIDAANLDLDRLSDVPSPDKPSPAPASRAPVVELLRDVASIEPALPTTVDLSVPLAVWANKTLRDIEGHLTAGSEGPRTVAVSGRGPGGSRLTFAAHDEKGALQGDLGLHADDASTSLDWLSDVGPDLRFLDDFSPELLDLKCQLRLEHDRALADNVDLLWNKSKIAGSAAFDYAPQRLKTDLKTAELDLDLSSVKDHHRAFPDNYSVDLKLKAEMIVLRGLADAPLKASSLALDIGAQGNHLAVHHVGFALPGGGMFQTDGEIDPDRSNFDIKLTAAHLSEVAPLMRGFLPSALLTRERTEALSPANVALKIAFARQQEGPQTVVSSKAHGSLGQTSFEVETAPRGAAENDVTLHLTNANGSALMRQFGLPLPNADLIGPSRVVLTGHGAIGKPFALSADAMIGSTRFLANGTLDPYSSWNGAGHLAIESSDALPLLQATGIARAGKAAVPLKLQGDVQIDDAAVATKDFAGTFGTAKLKAALAWPRNSAAPILTGSVNLDAAGFADLSGLVLQPSATPADAGPWSTAQFQAAPITPWRSMLQFNIETLHLLPKLTGAQAQFTLETSPDTLTIQQGSLSLAQGRAAYAWTLRNIGPQVLVDGQAALTNVDLRFPTLSGRLSGQIAFTGSGISPSDLIANLAGSGKARVENATLSAVEPQALEAVLRNSENESGPLNAVALNKTLAASKGTLTLDHGFFAATLVAGKLGFRPTSAAVESGPLKAALGGTYDLRTMDGTLEVTETLQKLPPDWTLPQPSLSIRTPLRGDADSRVLDTTALLDALTTRAIARESARVQALEFDLRERALFNARLNFDLLREQDRAKAEADARTAADNARKAEAERAAQAPDTRDQGPAPDGLDQVPTAPDDPARASSNR